MRAVAMGNPWRFPGAAGLPISLLLLAGTLRGQEEPVLLRPPQRDALLALDRLRARSPGPVEAEWNPATGRALALEGRFAIAAGPDLPSSCLSFLANEPALFGDFRSLDLRLAAAQEGLGTLHLRFQPFLSGVAISGAELVFHLDLTAPPGAAGPPEPALVSLRCELPLEGLALAQAAALGPPRLKPEEAAAIAEAAVAATVRGPDNGPLELRGATRAGLEILPLPSPARLTYSVTVDARRPRGLFQVRVDGSSGAVISRSDLLRYAPRDGRGKVFQVSPVVALHDTTLRDQDDSPDAVPAAAYSEVVLKELDGDGGLTGPFVTTSPTPRAVRRVRLDFQFLRDDDGFEEVMAYYHIDSAQRFIQSLGFKNVSNRQIGVYANSEPPGVPYLESQAYYQPDPDKPGTGVIAFGSGGIDAAEDPEVIIHEYGHALQDNQVPGFGGGFLSLETGAIGEGFADWLAASYLSAWSGGYGDTCAAEWFSLNGLDTPPGGGEEPVCLRRLDSPKHYPEAMDGEPHDDGEMWSSSLWKIFLALGRDDALRLVLESNFYLPTSATFEDGTKAVLRADLQLWQGAHQPLIRSVFEERGFLAPPLNLSWFYLRRHGAGLAVPAQDEPVTSKLKLERAGRISSDSMNPLRVYLKITHPSPGELDLTLRSPAGTSVQFLRAGSRFLPGRPMVFGPDLAPDEPFQSLAGEPVAGIWSLEVSNHTGDDGTLIEWGLGLEGFVRGDANRDGLVNISDSIVLLYYLFLRGEIACAEAADVNDDGSLSVTDAVGLILYLFGRSPPPADPFPQAGEDLTPDGLGCGR